MHRSSVSGMIIQDGRRSYLEISEGGFSWSSDVRDGRFQGDNGHENFVRFAVAWNSCEFVNGVFHSHRTLRDDGPTFRNFGENSG